MKKHKTRQGTGYTIGLSNIPFATQNRPFPHIANTTLDSTDINEFLRTGVTS